MKKFLLYILKVFLIGLVLAYVIAEFSFWSLRRGNFYKPSFVENSIEEKEVDYIILGASTALTGIDTKLLDSLTGLNGYNLAIDDTGLPNHYLMLAHFLETGYRTKKVILAPTESSLTQRADLGNNNYRFLMYHRKSYIQDYYAELEQNSHQFPVLSNTTYFPFLGISYYNVELFFPSLVSSIQPSKKNRFDERGNYKYPSKIFKTGLKKTDVVNVDFDHQYLKRIQELCKKNQIELYIYLPPIYRKKLTWRSTDLEIIDFTSLFKSNHFFYDRLHLNPEGNKIATEELAKTLL